MKHHYPTNETSLRSFRLVSFVEDVSFDGHFFSFIEVSFVGFPDLSLYLTVVLKATLPIPTARNHTCTATAAVATTPTPAVGTEHLPQPQ